MKTHRRILFCAATFLGCLCTHAETDADAVAAKPVMPYLKTDIVALIPQSLANTNISDPKVTCMLQINHLGKVEGIVALKASHIGLISRAENLIREAEFEPGDLAEGESVRLELVLGFSYPSQAGLGSMTTMDDVQIMINTVQAEDHSVDFKSPPELDAMPSLLDRGQIYVAQTPAGESISGTAKVEFYINHLGEVRLPRIIESTHPEVSKAAILSVQDMLFSPPMSGERPVVTKLRMPFNSGP